REMENTTIGVVATNARLTKEQANLVAMMAHDGIARAISPAHTLFDGDALFVLSVGDAAAEINAIGQAAAEVVAESIVRAVKNAARLFDIPAWRDVNG
ncbi:MAG TPA: P1 family peptidase, partial [Anaerolineae bacterium]